MAIAELVMPKLGESIMEATILKWHKKVGDHVKLDETVLDIATDKVDSEVPSTVEGTITEILYNVNDVVPIGTVIVRVETAATASVPTPAPVVAAPIVEAPAPIPAPVVEVPTPIVEAPQTPAPAPPPVPVAPPPVVEVPYTPSAPMVELMSKPASNRFYSPLVLNIANSEGISLSELERIPGTGNDGRVSKKDILQYVADKKAGKVPSFQPAPVYAAAPQYITPVATSAAPTQPVATPQEVAAPQPVATPEPVSTPTPVVETPVTAPAPTPLAAPAPAVEQTQPIVPVYQEPIVPVVPAPQPVAQQPAAPQPTYQAAPQPTYQQAPEPVMKSASRFPEQNVAAYAAPVPPSPQAIFAQPSGRYSDPSMVKVSGETEIIEMDRMRKLIAKHMVDSKHTSPHVTSFAEADVTNMVMWRTKVKNEFEQREGTKLTFTPMFVECIANVIKRFPYINCSLDGDKIILKKDINIGMATALPSGNLIVPVIKGADQMNIVGLSKAVNGLADAARNSKLKPEDTTGGTFTLTNVGTFGSLMGTPIISQPQVAIMAVGAIKKRPMVMEGPDGDTIAIRHMMYLSLSYDHRIVDGSIGASFLTEVAKEFEKWDINKQWFHYL
ncbi:2-oxo acid dehydrogenase subunit E2 [Sediminibacterium sp.]|uniref:dihydrolipoamide acetyltransferase family protein n=1 Tax=Sediminibacterium sp. TaxID=1917865 RepID=UPI0025E95CEC|nr:2-oxo acid dehydrogenase subunit E2 [Sediminibacterium sp.]MBT9485082.1 2-oxo acid dehydrogenase subunit E2 [Sediminibacterium sp.]